MFECIPDDSKHDGGNVMARIYSYRDYVSSSLERERKRESVPRKRVPTNDAMLNLIADELLNDANLTMPSGWKIYAVNQRRGKCSYHKKYITIPQWAIDKGDSYLDWYVAHELSHVFQFVRNVRDNHGPHFMSILKEICPTHCQKYEYTYKPRNAARACVARK
jgi:predicted metal-dependent hydrolase